MRRRFMRFAIIGTAAIVLAAAGFVLYRSMSRGVGLTDAVTSIVADSKLAIEKWAADQLLVIARGYLNPELTFSSIEFELPATLTLRNVTMHHEGVTFIDAAVLRIELTETPRRGQPIVIQSVQLIDPIVRLIGKESGGLIGFSQLLKTQRASEEESPPRLSEVFAIRKIAVINGNVEYQIPDQPPMLLDQLTFNLTTTPVHEATQTENGWYALDATFGRDMLFEWRIDGRLNVDTAVLAIQQSTLRSTLTPDRYSFLLPQVRAFVQDHEITGDLVAHVQGEIPLRNSAAIDLKMDVQLKDGKIAFGEYQLPVQSLDCAAHLKSDVLTIQPLNYAGLGGTARINGEVRLSGELPARTDFDVRDVRLEQMLRPQGDSAQPSDYQGRISFNGAASVNLIDVNGSGDGAGHVAVSEGRLINVPMIGKLARAAASITGNNAATDRGTANVRWRGNRISLTKIDFITEPIGIRGEGDFGFDSTIRFVLNAGPLERVQNSLGGVGELLGSITDKIVTYHVTGTFAEPQVSVRTLGIGGGSN